ncbi:hydrogenase iron-sulfur subunit [Archaeoglobus veneficus]|uniref:CoB--CoM heterodisulfide reductase iron-sulfur subunit A n=1 Tax=Archaeoglobus veneficus (strain DSM 11195 / SNP6) TaxID=693661 RepID=F2KPN5_ARCVS|nr:hydrogenase iron-sulfur subunit [Archaeoglobus veneficus]AEA47563.1 methyl-viologen-reducing hydrogenase delta subunit [Archaeoglobus veneficus SNP6]
MKRVGVYVCSGCGIGEVIDVEKLSAKFNARVHPFLCSSEGVEMIEKDIDEGIDTIVIAACSPRVNTDVFRFEGVVVERVNLREGVAWSHESNEETQALAEDYVRMGIVKAEKTELPEGEEKVVSRTILVVGGGIAGITAAVEAAEVGYEVILVEKNPYLGGRVAQMYKYFPKLCPPYCGLEINLRRLRENRKITVFTNAEVESISGEPGNFDVTVKINPRYVTDACTACGECVKACPAERPNEFNYGMDKTKAIYLPHEMSFPMKYVIDAEYCQKNEGCKACVDACPYDAIDLAMEPKTLNLKAGAIVVATGWKPYDAGRLTNLGFGKYPDVITNVMFERLASPNGPTKGKILTHDGKPVKRIAFVQCAGSRDENHLPYCSAVCCLASLKQATYIKEQYPDAEVYICYIDVRTPSLYEDFYRKVMNEGVYLVRGKVAEVTDIAKSPEEEGKLIVRVEDTLLGKVRRIPVDMVVLATGMQPNSTGLNLKYRQGSELPTNQYGFANSNFICFPYESQRTGIYAAGCVRQPMDVATAVEDASGAVMKAIQCIELVSKGMATFPRSGDLSLPIFFLQRCTQCKRCTEECPFSALEEDERGTPILNPARCRRCGTCFGACPERIISFKNYSIDMISSMIKAIDVPEEEGKFRILGFFCENDAYPALDMAARNGYKIDTSLRVIPVRCLGSVNVVFIADALSRGIDGILLAGCKYGEDYQCHFIRGSELANRRMENVQETLQRLMLEPERVKLVELAISDYDKIPQIIEEFVEQIKQIGPNPYKGF